MEKFKRYYRTLGLADIKKGKLGVVKEGIVRGDPSHFVRAHVLFAKLPWPCVVVGVVQTQNGKEVEFGGFFVVYQPTRFC